jgi:hypothetical protein
MILMTSAGTRMALPILDQIRGVPSRKGPITRMTMATRAKIVPGADQGVVDVVAVVDVDAVRATGIRLAPREIAMGHSRIAATQFLIDRIRMLNLTHSMVSMVLPAQNRQIEGLTEVVVTTRTAMIARNPEESENAWRISPLGTMPSPA